MATRSNLLTARSRAGSRGWRVHGGHAPPGSFDELLRVTRPGGLLIFTLATSAYERGGFKDKLDALEANGQWQLIEATAPFLGMRASTSHRGHTGRVLVFEVADSRKSAFVRNS